MILTAKSAFFPFKEFPFLVQIFYDTNFLMFCNNSTQLSKNNAEKILRGTKQLFEERNFPIRLDIRLFEEPLKIPAKV